MAKIKLQSDITNAPDQNLESVVLETRKVKALEKIANSLDDISVWISDIDKDEWSERIQFYLSEFLLAVKPKDSTKNE